MIKLAYMYLAQEELMIVTFWMDSMEKNVLISYEHN